MSTIPVNVQVPSATDAPMVADFVEHALRAGYVLRPHLRALPVDDWGCPGVYVLLTSDGSGGLYVGQAVDLRKRVMQHVRKDRLLWTRAVLIKRDTSHGFNSAEIGYLEGRLAAELGAVANLTVVEGKKDMDSTLPPHMMISLDALLVSMLAALRLAGLDVSKEADEPEPAKKRGTPAIIDGTVPDLVSAGLLRAGVALHLTQGGRNKTGTVTAAGEIVVDGVAYASPSKASAVALGHKTSNGWTTWHVGNPDGPTLADLRNELNGKA